MNRRMNARRAGVIVACCALFALLGGRGASAGQCDPNNPDCTPNGAQGQALQYHFDSFTTSCGADCGRTTGDQAARLDGVRHPPSPCRSTASPNPSTAIAQGRLYVPGGSGQAFAVGRIYRHPPNPCTPQYLFDGHLIPGSETPPGPPTRLSFLGRIYSPGPPG